MNAALSASSGGRACVYFPAGRWALNSAQSYTFASTLASITIEGAGQDVSELYFPNATSGLTFNYNGAFDSVHLKNLSLTSGAGANSTIGISLNQMQTSNSNPGNTALSDISNVTLRGADGYLVGAHWGTGVQVSGVSNVNFYGDYIIGPAGNGVVLQGTSSNIPVVFNFTNTFFNNLTT
ncbi:hypothetical protein, partial [Caballeronia sp. BR00000012568055]|uniref:hypothetical protein n=1 Tax=Caballeronia sp. BR00000012568055 TaxID=2918761 RepID=UPI0023F7F684